MQALHVAGGTHFVGVNYGAMDKYRQPLTAEQWRHCVASLKVLHHSSRAEEVVRKRKGLCGFDASYAKRRRSRRRLQTTGLCMA